MMATGRPKVHRWLGSAMVVLLAGVLVACGDDDDDTATDTNDGGESAAASGAEDAAARYTTPLEGICPDKVVFQTNWWPETDHGLLYQLIGPGGEVDTGSNTYTGPLGSTGVDLEIRAGGPATGYQQVSAQLYQDDDILLGFVGTDEQIANSAEQPTTAVLAWYQKTPQVFMWGNPDWDFASVADIGESGETVLAFEGATYLDVFTGEGLLEPDQIDTSYQGDPARFVAEDGNVVQQGFATNEPYLYENVVEGWQRPVDYLLVGDEYPVYINAVGVRPDKLEGNRECVEKLVPLLQQAAVDYAADPGPTNEVLLDYTSQLAEATSLSADGLADASAKQVELGLVANGTDGVFGSFDLDRVQDFIDTVTPALTEAGTPPADGLVPDDLVTNEFLDPEISL